MSTNRQLLNAPPNKPASGLVRSGMNQGWLRAVFSATALALLVGCAGTPDLRRTAKVKQALRKTHATAGVSHTKDYVAKHAAYHTLPQEYITEATVGISKVEQELDSARAAEYEREATLHQQAAELSAKRGDVVAQQKSALAEIDTLRKERAAKQEELAADLAASQRNAQTELEKNERLRKALAKERRTAQTDLVNEARQAYAESQARIKELRNVRLTTEQEGVASVEVMRKTAEATRTRADASAAALRTAAQSRGEQTSAQLAALQTQLDTIPHQVQGEVNRLLAQASYLENDARSNAGELNARADAMEQQDGEHQYQLMVTRAETGRQRKQATQDRRTSNVKTEYVHAMAEIDRARGDAHVIIQNAQSWHTKQMGELSAWLKNDMAEVDKMHSKADRLEKSARAEFVKAEAESRADALRETAEHLEAVSEAQMKAIMAEAEAEAARLRKEIMGELSKKMKSGSFEFEGSTAPTPNQPAELHSVPQNSQVADITPRIEPEAVARFRSALAQVMHERTKADSRQVALEATYNERKDILESIKSEKVAICNEQLAIADAGMLKVVAVLSDATAKINSRLAVARSDYDRALVEAETFRRSTLADVANLRATAKSFLDEGLAKVTALKKEADVITKSGEAEVEAVQASYDANKRTGEAEVTRLLADADGIQQSQTALAEQIEAQIASAELSLEAELTSLDRRIEADTIVADANQMEALAQAEVLGQKTDLALRRMQARAELEEAIARAQLERTHGRHFVETIKGEAEIERLLAGVQAERDRADAMIDAEQVAIRAQSDIATAESIAQQRIAEARKHAIRSRFNSRIVQVAAPRVKAGTDSFLDEFLHRSNVESIVAEAKAASARTTERLAILAKNQAALQKAAVKNWDSRLAKQKEKVQSDDKEGKQAG